MTERAGDAEPRDVIVGIHRRLQTHDRIHLEQRDRRRRTLEIDLLEDAGRQHVRVHFEPDLQRRRRIHALLNDLVQAELVGPELFVTEGFEAKNALALGQPRLMTPADWLEAPRGPTGGGLRSAGIVVPQPLSAAPAVNTIEGQRRRTNWLPSLP